MALQSPAGMSHDPGKFQRRRAWKRVALQDFFNRQEALTLGHWLKPHTPGGWLSKLFELNAAKPVGCRLYLLDRVGRDVVERFGRYSSACGALRSFASIEGLVIQGRLYFKSKRHNVAGTAIQPFILPECGHSRRQLRAQFRKSCRRGPCHPYTGIPHVGSRPIDQRRVGAVVIDARPKFRFAGTPAARHAIHRCATCRPCHQTGAQFCCSSWYRSASAPPRSP